MDMRSERSKSYCTCNLTVINVESRLCEVPTCSWNHLQAPFHVLLGSIANAFRTIAKLASPQKDGSSCVLQVQKATKASIVRANLDVGLKIVATAFAYHLHVGS